MTDDMQPASAGDTAGPVTSLLRGQFRAAIQEGSLATAKRVVQCAVARGLPGETIYADVLCPALCDIGELWENNTISVADEHLATAITSRVMSIVSELLVTEPPASKERLLITSVEGDHHVVGVQMIADVLEGAGYDVLLLGGDTPLGALLDSVARHDPHLVALGATGPGSGERLTQALTELRQSAPALPIAVGGSRARGAAETVGDPHVHFVQHAGVVLATVRSAIEHARATKPRDQPVAR